mmetsp:Transcript_6241/g.18833  ORF Transcript_6241/g.18833 Transcript_6241/m.18833 type:complete len:497 (+) Transcript_6241:142-1632(+)
MSQFGPKFGPGAVQPAPAMPPMQAMPSMPPVSQGPPVGPPAQAPPVVPPLPPRQEPPRPPGGHGTGGQVPPPFLTKLYDLVDDEKTNDLVSWSPDGTIFTVHRTTQFARDVLPKYFKHNNFSSFVRQLNQYGFHKQDPDNWTFGHDNFKRGRKDLLAEISRRKSKNQIHASPNSNLIQVVPGKDNPLANQKLILELGNYGILGDVDRLQRDKEMLMKELMMARKQLVLARKQESQMQQKCDMTMRRVEQLEGNMKKMQQFLFYYFQPALKNYNAKSKRKRLPPSSSSEQLAKAKVEGSSENLPNVETDPETAQKLMSQLSGLDSGNLPANLPPSNSFPPASVQELTGTETLPQELVAPVVGDLTGVSLSSSPDLKKRRISDENIQPNGPQMKSEFDVTPANAPPGPPDGGNGLGSAQGVKGTGQTYHQPTENGFETVFYDDPEPVTWTSKGDEEMLDEILNIDDAGSNFPPLNNLPNGTDVDAFAQRMEDFQDAAY